MKWRPLLTGRKSRKKPPEPPPMACTSSSISILARPSSAASCVTPTSTATSPQLTAPGNQQGPILTVASVAKPSSILDNLIDIAMPPLNLVKECADVLPPLKSAVGGGLNMAERGQRQKSAKEECDNLSKVAIDRIALLMDPGLSIFPDSLQKEREDLVEFLHSVRDRAHSGQRRLKGLQGYWWRLEKVEGDIRSMSREIQERMVLFDLARSAHTARKIEKLHAVVVETKEDIQKILKVIAEKESTAEAETVTAVLETVTKTISVEGTKCTVVMIVFLPTIVFF